MARDERGVVIAWTARNLNGLNRLYVARLDAGAHVVGSVREIPTASTADTIDVDSPSIAKSAIGPGFVLAWIETGSSSTAVFSLLNADLDPAPPRTLTAVDASSAGSAVIARSGKFSWLTANGVVLRVNADGTWNGVPDGVTASDMVAVTDFPIAVGGKQTQTLTRCTCGGPHDWTCPYGCSTFQLGFALQVVWLYSASASMAFTFDTSAQPAIQSNGTDVIIVWFDGAQARGGAIVASRFHPSDITRLDQFHHEVVLGSFAPDAGPTRADIATDGDRYVAVWRTATADGTYDVVGASIDRDDKVTYLPIAISAADERDPSVIAVGDGRFLVAYEKITGNERRLAGRFVDFGNRRHAVR